MSNLDSVSGRCKIIYPFWSIQTGCAIFLFGHGNFNGRGVSLLYAEIRTKCLLIFFTSCITDNIFTTLKQKMQKRVVIFQYKYLRNKSLHCVLLVSWTRYLCRPFLYGSAALVGLGVILIEVLRFLSDTPHSVGLLWTSARPVAETCTWQEITLTKGRPPCPRQYSNP